MVDRAQFDAALRRAAAAGAAVARYCDHAEHVEPADVTALSEAAEELRLVAVDLAATLGVDLIELYAQRLDVVENRFTLGIVDGFEAGREIRLAESWRDLQLIQGHHDRLYRPDVNGLARMDQLRHVCLHVAKLVGAIATAEQNVSGFCTRALPDLCLLGVKLSTIIGEPLSAALPRERLPKQPAT